MYKIVHKHFEPRTTCHECKPWRLKQLGGIKSPLPGPGWIQASEFSCGEQWPAGWWCLDRPRWSRLAQMGRIYDREAMALIDWDRRLEFYSNHEGPAWVQWNDKQWWVENKRQWCSAMARRQYRTAANLLRRTPEGSLAPGEEPDLGMELHDLPYSDEQEEHSGGQEGQDNRGGFGPHGRSSGSNSDLPHSGEQERHSGWQQGRGNRGGRSSGWRSWGGGRSSGWRSWWQSDSGWQWR